MSEHLRPTRMALWRLVTYTREALADWPRREPERAWMDRHEITDQVSAAYRAAEAGADTTYCGLADNREAWPLLAICLCAVLRRRLETPDPAGEATWRMVAGVLLPLVEADYLAIRRASTCWSG